MEYVLLDTNAWRSTALLRSMLGRSLIFHLQSTGKRILMPETVEKEVISVLTAHLSSLCEDIDKASSGLEQYGTPFDNSFYLPDETEVRQAIKERIAGLSPLIFMHPLTLDEARGALNMVVRHDPPNIGKREEFRDSLIWQSLLAVEPADIVAFVTADKAFYRDQDYRKGLAEPLERTAKNKHLGVSIYQNLEEYLHSTLKGVPALDEGKCTHELRDWLDLYSDEVFSKLELYRAVFASAEYIPVPSIESDIITVQFHLTYKSSDVSPQRKEKRIEGGEITLKGTACFTIADTRLIRAEVTEHEESKIDQSGATVDPRIVFYSKKNEATNASDATSKPALGAASSAHKS